MYAYYHTNEKIEEACHHKHNTRLRIHEVNALHQCPLYCIMFRVDKNSPLILKKKVNIAIKEFSLVRLKFRFHHFQYSS